jgi:DNA (cytosine-5)-methyltransferase 1
MFRMDRKYDVTGLFAGIGGFELGLAAAGHSTSLFCESDPDAIAVLSARFPGIPFARDVRATDELIERISPTSNLLTAGFPCTDLSQAGKTQGFEGGRSGLIRDVIRLLEKRPFEDVLIENVPNWRLLHRGAYFGEVLQALEGLGYRWAYRVIDARAFGLPQRRLRLFVHACLSGDPRRVLCAGNVDPVERSAPLEESAHGFYWTEGARGLGWGENCVPTLKGGSTLGIPAPPAVIKTDLTIVTPSLETAEDLQGFARGWTALHERPKLVGGGRFNSRRRWLMIGNAVNVRVSAWLGDGLRHSVGADMQTGDLLAAGAPWPSAGWFDGSDRRSLNLSTWPLANPTDDLEAKLDEGAKLLSLRATSGFYSRLRSSSLRRASEFDAALENHIRRMERDVNLRFGELRAVA